MLAALRLTERMPKFVQFLVVSLQSPSYFDNIITRAMQVSAGEERLYYVFLVTHFQSAETASAFHTRISWARLNNTRASDLRRICDSFLGQSRFIGDHRRYFRAMLRTARSQYTYETLMSYVGEVRRYGSQSSFFELSGKPQFETLYARMAGIKNLNSRIARFDHLENLSRTHNFFIVPPKTFYSEDASGPLDGMTFYYFGEKFRTKKGKLQSLLLSDTFQSDWNSQVTKTFQIMNLRDNYLGILRKLEGWLITNTRKRVPRRLVDEAFVYDLESCLCNWQKGKK